MTKPVEVELWGGPLDGQRHAIVCRPDDTYRTELRFLLPPARVDIDETIGMIVLVHREARYVEMFEPRRFVFIGEYDPSDM